LRNRQCSYMAGFIAVKGNDAANEQWTCPQGFLWYIQHSRRPLKPGNITYNGYGHMSVVEEIELANGLVLQVRDRSRPIAPDTTKVEVELVLPVEVREGFFDNDDEYRLVKKIFGSHISFIIKKERTFVKKENRESVFAELLDDFMEDSLPYLERPDFPARFVRAKLADIRKRPHRYRSIRR